MYKDLVCWSLRLDNNLVAIQLEVKIRKFEVLKLAVGLLTDLIKISNSSSVHASSVDNEADFVILKMTPQII